MGAGAGKEASWAQALSNTTLGDVLGSLPKKIILKLDENSTLAAALRFFAEHKILSVPITRGGESDIGFLDMLDIVAFFADLPSQSTNGFRDPKTLEIPVSMNPVLEFGRSDKLIPILEKMLETRAYRVAVIEDDKIVDLLTQSDVITYIWNNRGTFATQMGHTLQDLGLAQKQVLTCSPSDITMKALAEMQRRAISALAIVDEDQRFVAALSASALRGLGPHQAPDLLLPIGYFMAKYKHSFSREFVLPTVLLSDAVQLLHKHRIHRLFVVDGAETMRPIGIISLTDIMRVLASS